MAFQCGAGTGDEWVTMFAYQDASNAFVRCKSTSLSYSKAVSVMKELYFDSFGRSLMGEQVAGGGEVESVTDRRAVCVNIQRHQYTLEENAASLNTGIPNISQLT